MGKVRLRKIFIVCEDNKVIDERYQFTNFYRRREYAESVCRSLNQKELDERNAYYNKGHKMRSYRVHGFYLLHESLFDEKA